MAGGEEGGLLTVGELKVKVVMKLRKLLAELLIVVARALVVLLCIPPWSVELYAPLAVFT